jgi:hypothetical protein
VALPVLLLFALLSAMSGAVRAAQAQEAFFETRVRPVLESHCFACHTGSKLGGLELSSREALLKGGKSGTAIVPGQPRQSLLLQAVSYTHERLKMPPQGKLPDEVIADLTRWVEMGAPWPAVRQLESVVPKSEEYLITPAQRHYWAFQPLNKPGAPAVKHRDWPRSPIDQFILARLESQGLAPVEPATKEVFIRRATFDLTGLPPTPAETDDFLKDTSPKAFAKVVDRLLSSPHYGERWGRYWLDVARFAEDDTHGWTKPFPNAFRYRDWVIDAFNQDLPYDLFVKAQVAADLLGRPDTEKFLPGLGFMGIGPRFQQVIGPVKGLAEECNDRVDVLSRGFLGLTAACARCHDHKFDPISVKDYYALAGIFASSDYHEYPLAPAKVVQEYQELEKRISDNEAALKEFVQLQGMQLAEILAAKTARYLEAAWRVLKQSEHNSQTAAAELQLDPETLERWVKYLRAPEKDHPYLTKWNELLAHGGQAAEIKKVAEDFQTLVLSIIGKKKAVDEKNRLILAQAEDDKYCKGCSVSVLSMERDAFVLWGDLFDEKRREDGQWTEGGVLVYEGEKIDRFLGAEWRTHLEWMRQQLAELKRTLPPAYPYLHGIADSGQPANLRIHLRGNPENLGEEAPRRFLAVLSESSPPLFQNGSGRLELAEALVRHPLTARVIVNRVWQHHFGQGIVRTPNNFGQLGEQPSHPELLDYLASRLVEQRWSLKALHREIVLSATYQLSSAYSERNFAADPDNRLLWRANRQRLDAEALRDALLYVSGSLDPTVGGPSVELTKENRRRTVYSKISRHKPDVFLGLFDFPHATITSEQRNVTNVPLQQLFFLNSDVIHVQSERLAQRLCGAAPDDAARIQQAYRLLFGRLPTSSELETGLEFLRSNREDPSETASVWKQYAQVLLSSNEFSFVD